MILSKPQENYDESSDKILAPLAQKKSTQPPSSSLLADNSKPSKKKAWKKNKKKYCQEHKKDPDNLATGVNTDDVISSRAPKDKSLVTYFNCDRTGHYTRNCPKLKCDSSKTLKNW